MTDPEKQRRGRPSTLDIDKTLEIAMHAYWRADPADVSINAICELAGVSKPSLYRAFGNEDGLMRAVLDRYASEVLSNAFGILTPEAPLSDTLQTLIHFASQDQTMETGCVFFKMRAGKHRLGPRTLEGVEALDRTAVEAFAQYLEARRIAGDWAGHQPAPVAARYLVEQLGLALMQRASGEDPVQINATLNLALSVFRTT